MLQQGPSARPLPDGRRSGARRAGRPICCELWPGNTADVTTLIPVVDRMWRRFRIRKVCVVADRGMIRQETIDDLDQQGWPYILGARMRRQNEVREQVLTDRRRFHEVHE